MTIRARIVHDTGVADRRAAPRLPVEIDAKVRELGTTGTEARVLNISETGFMAETCPAASAPMPWCAGSPAGSLGRSSPSRWSRISSSASDQPRGRASERCTVGRMPVTIRLMPSKFGCTPSGSNSARLPTTP